MIKYWVFIGVIGLLFACNQDDCCEPDEDNLPSIEVEEIASSGQDLAGAIFKQIVRSVDPGENVIISPLSIQVALYMTYNGANGTTRQAMAETLGWSQEMDPASVNEAYKELLSLLTPQNDSVDLTLANAVFWDQNRIQPIQAFKDAMENSYHAGLFAEPFGQDPDGTVEKINDWVDEQTVGRIQKILEQLTPEEVMFLMNALYIKASWANPFEPNATYDFPFTTQEGQIVQVPFMSKDFQLDFYDGSDFQAVKLPFTDSHYAMHFVLPKTEDLDQFIEDMEYTTLFEDFDHIYQAQRIQLYLPKIESEFKTNLNDALKSLGMEIAFDAYNADFSNLGEANGNLFVSRVEHKTFFKMDEKGVEGAAVTAVGIGVTSAPPQVRFDRPFLMVLYHHHSGQPIFIGKISNPQSK